MQSRTERFDNIWNKTEGSDFDKTLAMLYEYCKLRNWGTHANPVWGKIKNHFTITGYRQPVKNKDAIRYTLPYLFLRLSENFSFASIKPDGDLAAIFHVIQMHANINPYDFNQKTDLYKIYAEFKDDIRNVADVVTNWNDLINRVAADEMIISESKSNITFRYTFIGELLKAKLIDYLDSWNLIVGLENAGAFRVFEGDYVALTRDVLLFDQYCPIAEENLRGLFNSDKYKYQSQFLQYLYCKYYKLDIEDYYYVSKEYGVTGLIQVLCRLSGEMPVDGVFLQDMINKISLTREMYGSERQKFMNKFYAMYIALIEKRYFISNWKEIEFKLRWFTGVNFFDLLVKAIENQSIDTIYYLINNLKIKFDLKAKCISYPYCPTPLQILIEDAKNFATPKYGYAALNKFRDIVKILIDHDRDCIRAKDIKGHDIFYYLNHTMMCLKSDYTNSEEIRRFKCNYSEEAIKILDEIYAMIDSAYYYRKQAFAFFSCHHNKDGVEGALPMDVVNLIKDHTMYSEITVRNKI